jgi:hypothetical protein
MKPRALPAARLRCSGRDRRDKRHIVGRALSIPANFHERVNCTQGSRHAKFVSERLGNLLIGPAALSKGADYFAIGLQFAESRARFALRKEGGYSLIEVHANGALSIERIRGISEDIRGISRSERTRSRTESKRLENGRMPFGLFRGFLAMQSSRKTYCVSIPNRSIPGQLTTYVLVEGPCSRWQ